MIATIGDSWVGSDRYLSREIKKELRRRGWSAGIASFSYPGLRVAPIFRKLFCSPVGQPAIRADYGVISVGINDALAHAGSRRYAASTILLLRSVLALGIKPILLEIPRFGQQDAIEEESWHAGARHTINRYLFDLGKRDTIEEYRRGMRGALLRAPELLSQSILLSPDPAVGSFSRANPMWRNPSHLSLAGESALGAAIACAIAADLENR